MSAPARPLPFTLWAVSGHGVTVLNDGPADSQLAVLARRFAELVRDPELITDVSVTAALEAISAAVCDRARARARRTR